MACRCKRPNIIKNKFISTIIGTFGFYLGIGFIFVFGYFSIYITSYIHIHQNFVNMHYGYFLGFIFNLSNAFGGSIGGLLEKKWGYLITSLFGTIIIFVFNLFFIHIQNIWFCYCLTLILGIGAGISTSLLVKNLVFFYPNKKGVIVSVFYIFVLLISGGFVLGGEKFISPEGETLGEGQEVYSPETSKRIYYYFFLGVFAIPVGDIIFFLFAHEYKKEVEITDILQKEDNNTNNEVDKNKNNDEKNSYDNKNENIYEQKQNESKEINDDIEEKKGNLLKTEEDQEKQDFNNNNEDSNKESKITEDKNKKKNKIRQILKTFRFWRITLASFLEYLPLSFMNGTWRTFGAIIGIKGNVLQLLALSQGIGMILVGPIFGFLSDKKGPLLILKISAFISIIPGIILFFFTKNIYLFMISFVIVAISSIAKSISLHPFLMEIYGINESVVLVGINSGISFLGEGAILATIFILSFRYKGIDIAVPYKYLFIGGSVCGLLSFVLFLIENKNKFEYKNLDVALDLLIDDEDKKEKENIETNEVEEEEEQKNEENNNILNIN